MMVAYICTVNTYLEHYSYLALFNATYFMYIILLRLSNPAVLLATQVKKRNTAQFIIP